MANSIWKGSIFFKLDSNGCFETSIIVFVSVIATFVYKNPFAIADYFSCIRTPP